LLPYWQAHWERAHSSESADGWQVFITIRIPDSGFSVAAQPEVACSCEDGWYTAVGEPSLFRARNLMPVELAINILLELYTTSILPKIVQWV
jgi:hypothetical protein